MSDQKILITICARANSKGLPNKHMRIYADRYLIYWTVKQAHDWVKLSSLQDDCKVVLFTDDITVENYVSKMELSLEFLTQIIDRPYELSTDTTLKLDCLRYILSRHKGQIKLLIDLDATNPVRTVQDIENCYQMFLNNTHDVVMSATPAKENPHFNQLQHWSSGWGLPTFSKADTYNRQEAPEVYHVNSSIYVYNPEWLKDDKHKSPITDHLGVYIMPAYSRVDIDTQDDFDMSELMFRKYILQ